MKKTILALVALIIFALSGCTKTKQGVLEVRKYVAYPYTSTGSSLFFNESFFAMSVDPAIVDLVDGEIKEYFVNGQAEYSGYTHVQYIYHADKNLNNLGYTQKIDAEVSTHYGTADEYYYTKESDGVGLPAENSGFSQIAGAWKYPTTGEVIWIDSDRSGTAKLIFGGSNLPPEAEGGIVMSEVIKTGDYTYQARNHTYFEGSGWVPSGNLSFEISKDGKTFLLGSITWTRVN